MSEGMPKRSQAGCEHGLLLMLEREREGGGCVHDLGTAILWLLLLPSLPRAEDCGHSSVFGLTVLVEEMRM